MRLFYGALNIVYIKGETIMEIIVTNDNFESEVLKSDKPVLADFFATWCGPCTALAPIIKEIAEERTDIKVVKIDVDKNMELASKFKVMSIPTIIVFKNGEAVNRTMGLQSKEKLLELL